ncbi:rod shape-determining protein MreD [Candidatus Methylacidithermus pantelleriae]|uniref:Rod shape-determining protein MreD (Modular protein) n=1 Tax=Candidatus Methylacidithermus pantelleriae TaxID=2744239 RepID=A0A8J2BHQ1_9BACT|nr:rod shape-determining protein MreD [Candidatus Methylacidithermus pantelleriae]CAF0689909.1 Rod shape-determining protein MreD (modular protein) [Candidatus Methylacidithermus pantelleriae]
MVQWLILVGVGALSVMLVPLFPLLPWVEVRPYLPLLVVSYAAVRFPLVLSMVLAAFVGALWDVVCSPYFGLHFFLCLFFSFFFSLQTAALGKSGALSFLALVVGASFLYFLGGYLFYLWRETAWRWSMQVLYQAAYAALLTGMCAPLVLLGFDFLLFRDETATLFGKPRQEATHLNDDGNEGSSEQPGG